MKKQLLFGFAALSVLAVNAQNARQLPANTPVKNAVKLRAIASEPTNEQYVAPSKNTTSVNKIMGPAAKRFGGSTNAFGVLVPESQALSYNSDINTVGMIFRKQAGWSGVPSGSSGSVAYAWSLNGGTTVDSTIIASAANKLCRYPAGVIFNPAGNTTPANALAVGTGPWHPGASWQGNFYVSKPLTAFGANMTGRNAQGSAMYHDNLALTTGQIKHDFTRVDPQATADGKVHVLAGLYEDINGTTAAAQKWRGAALATGVYNAGTFNWSWDSIIPNFKVDGAGEKISYGTSSQQAWSEDGTTGYVIFVGCDANAQPGTPMHGYNPLVYKTTNSGATWARYSPLFDFSSIPALSDRLFPINTGTMIKPFFSLGEGSDAVVDGNGNLHFVCTVTSGSSDHVDSLGYTYGANYNFLWDYIVDVATISNTNSWTAMVIDSLHCGGPVVAESNWTSSTGNLAYDARIQVARTKDGSKLFYTWADSDTTFTGNHISTLPDIQCVAYDVNTSMRTAGRKNLTAGIAGVELGAYWYYTAPIVGINGSDFQVHNSVSLSDDASNNGDIAVSHYYLGNGMIPAADLNQHVVVTNIKSNNVNNLVKGYSVYPNPATSKTTLEVVLNENAALNVTVLNNLGQVVYSNKVNGSLGLNSVNIDLNNFNNGVYFLNVTANNSKPVVTKFVVAK